MKAALFVHLILSLAGALDAQSSRIEGRVTDPQGKVVAGATVHLRQSQSEIALTRSDGDGSFHFDRLPAGNYTVAANAPGFAPVSKYASVPGGVADLQFGQLAAQSQSLVITAKTLEPGI